MREIDWEYGSIANDLEEMRELGAEFWPETTQAQAFDVEYNLSDDFFSLCEERGILGVLLGRDPETRELVGIYVAILTPWIFCRHLTMSSEVVWFIRRDYMSKQNVIEFLRAAESANAKWGADYVGITMHDIGNVDRARETMKRQGYVMSNLFFLKQVG